MSEKSSPDELTVRYLLGELAEAEQQEFEMRFLGSGEAVEEIRIVEEELIDDYVHGVLSPSQSERFAKAYLVEPDRALRVVGFGRAFDRIMTGRKASEPRPVASSVTRAVGRRLLAAAAVGLFLATAYLAYQSIEMRQQIRRLQIDRTTLASREPELQKQVREAQNGSSELRLALERERAEKDQLSERLAKVRPQAVVAFILSPSPARGEEAVPTLPIPGAVDLVRLTLRLTRSDSLTYRAVLETPDGEEVWHSGMLKLETHATGKSLSVHVPAPRLKPATYILIVEGLTGPGTYEEVADFSFRVTRL